MEALRVSLDSYDAEVVRQIALTLGLRDADTKPVKSKLIQRLLTEIPRRAGTAEFIKALSDTDRVILALVMERGGQVACSHLLVSLFLSGLLPIALQADGMDLALSEERMAGCQALSYSRSQRSLHERATLSF